MLLLLLVLKKRCLIEKRCRWSKIDGKKMLKLMMIITWPLIVGRWQRRKQSGEVAVVMWHYAMSSACVMRMLHVCGGGG